jgi:hypothetical protein
MRKTVYGLLMGLLLLAAGSADANVLVNSGFESGALAPSFNSDDFCGGCTWTVTGADFHAGAFSAEVSGNRLLEQDFAAVATSDISKASLWLRMPDTGIAAIFFKYGDSSTEENIVSPSAAWTEFDMTTFLDVGKTLVGFGVFGCSGCPGNSVTRADDFVVEAGAVPEPVSFTMLGLALGGFALSLRRRRV